MTTLERIALWGHERNLIHGQSSQAQMVKLMEEVGELAEGIARSKHDVIVDSIGDCVVVLTMIAEQNDKSIQACIDAAYNEIKDRTGKMVNGIFVKDEHSTK